MKTQILLLTLAATSLALGCTTLSSCAHDYHNPAVEADAAGPTQAASGPGPVLKTGTGGQSSNVPEERKAKALAFWGGAP